MNIKIKNNKTYLIASLWLLLLSFSAIFLLAPPVSAEPSQSDPVVSHCMSEVPKARATCQDKKLIQEIKNVATHHCPSKKHKNKANCVTELAKGYISDAAKGKPNDAKFKRQLDDVLKKAGGDRNNAAEGFGALEPETVVFASDDSTYPCGNGDNVVKTKFDFGCLGPDGPKDMSAIEDLLYAILRFMSAGVGIIIVIAIILAGIQYTTSEGNPETTQSAKNKIQNAVVGLVIYIFAFSAVQFLVPGGAFAGSIYSPNVPPLINISEAK